MLPRDLAQLMQLPMGDEATATLLAIGASAVEPLIGALQDPALPIRRWAAFGLGVLRDDRAVQPLIAALEDHEWSVRMNAAGALGRIGSRLAVVPLSQALQDHNPNVRDSAVWALEMLHDEQTLPALIHVLRDPERSVRTRAVAAVARFGERALVPLIQLFGTAPAYAYPEMVETLEWIGDARAYDQLYRLADHPDPIIRAAVIRAISSLAKKEAIPLFVTALRDQHALVRAAAASALGTIKGAVEKDALIAALHDEDADVRAAVAEALGTRRVKQAVPSLLALLADTTATTTNQVAVNVTIIEALGVIGDRRAVAPLIQILQDGLPDARWAAAYALGKLGDTHATFALREAQQYDHEEVSWGGETVAVAAAYALVQLNGKPET